jgi:hypothetical protein
VSELIELPAWLVAFLVAAATFRGVLRDAIEHDGLVGLLRGSQQGVDPDEGDEGS